MEINLTEKYKKTNFKKKKKKNLTYYIYKKLVYFAKNYCSNNIMRRR